ncbi:hypothetical protein E2C01_096566 [Portunus trituberculatus]|uniref:Uncharacterized protein n=1 Tax=Portunus trituberculatus TaxID=210409 RepID=A0A5B7K346_PORTR|nr:hypothetical protein [Portunus trituberculatus]
MFGNAISYCGEAKAEEEDDEDEVVIGMIDDDDDDDDDDGCQYEEIQNCNEVFFFCYVCLKVAQYKNRTHSHPAIHPPTHACF